MILPTETVHAIAVRADDGDALARLWSARGDISPAPLAWHASTVAHLREVIRLESPVHRRIVARLLPGPVQLAIEMTEQNREGLRAQLGVATGVIDDGEHVLVRVSSHPVAAKLLALCEFPVVMAGAVSRRNAGSLEDVISDQGAQVSAVLDGSPAPAGIGSTLIRLHSDGGYDVARPGLLQERLITRTMTRTILFVCSGNTCRSPMASAVARSLVDQQRDGIETRIISAGTSTGPGAPASPEAVRAVGSLGVSLDSHASRPLTRELLTQADIVFAMTGAHRDRILDLDPESREKVHLLDPEGVDVPDPFGQSQSVYDETARRLDAMVRSRLSDLDSLDPKERTS